MRHRNVNVLIVREGRSSELPAADENLLQNVFLNPRIELDC